jgi:hypothetical protein
MGEVSGGDVRLAKSAEIIIASGNDLDNLRNPRSPLSVDYRKGQDPASRGLSPTGSPLRVPSVYAALPPQRSARCLVALDSG